MAIDDLLDEHEQSERVRAWLRNNAAGLIGGVKVTVGDVVIDASVRGRLDQMATTLKQ